MGKVIAVLVLVISVFAGVYYWTSFDRVDPGNIGILVDYGDGSIDAVTETKWIWIGRYQKLIEYNAQEQNLIMDIGSEGQIKGDDATECLTRDTQRIKIDSNTSWRINPAMIVQVYKDRRDVPLTGPRDRDGAGNYIEDIIVRNEVRSAIYKVCSEFGWADVLGDKQTEFQTRVFQEAKRAAEPLGVLISAVTIRQRIPDAGVDALMKARLAGQQQQEQSAFVASQQKRQQEIDLNASIAAAEKARIEAEARAKVDIANANAAAEVARVKAQQEAEAIRIRGEAEAASLRAQAQAVTPALVDLERARKWNGQGPTTIMGGDPQIINQVPLR